MRTLLIVLFGLLPASTFASVGDMYVCKRTEVNNAGYIDEFILSWNADYYEVRLRQVDGSLTGTFKYTFNLHHNNYFASTRAYEQGHFLESFDGKIFARIYVKEGYTYVSEYICPKF